MSQTALELKSVCKLYGPHAARSLERYRATGRLGPSSSMGVWDVSLTIPQGRTSVLMGLSGSGKSTLLRLLNGLHQPTAGSVRVGGTELSTLKRQQLVRLRRETFSGMVFQGFALLPHRTALGNVAFGLELQRVKKRERLERAHMALELVGLGGHEHRYPRDLSGGMQQRLGLARALTLEGDILLMDEPFSALDPITRRELQAELLRLQERVQKTIVLVTHDMEEALKLGDQIALLKEGRVQQIGTPEEIVSRPANAYVAAFVAGVDRVALLTASSIMAAPTPVEHPPRQHPAPDHWVSPETSLADVVRITSQNTATLSVLSAEGQLLGTITPQNVLAALAANPPNTQLKRSL